MCFNISFICGSKLRTNCNETEINRNENTNNVVSHLIKLNGYGQTKRYKTNIVTFWKDIKIVYNPVLGTFDGVGKSVFNRKEYNFLLIGNIEETINNKIIIKIKKIHIGMVSNNIDYVGEYSNNDLNDEIHLVSHQSSGFLKLKIN